MAPLPLQVRSSVSLRNGFAEPRSERLLHDLLQLAGTFTGRTVVVLLQDGEGIWYRDGAGLSEAQRAGLAQAPSGTWETLLQGPGGLELPLLDAHQRPLGTLRVLPPGPESLPAPLLEGLRLLAVQFQAILAAEWERREQRATPRAPAAASFVPGLVHELHNFRFGISASLDAFEARFAEQPEMSRYGSAIRKGLDRLSAFIAELQEFGDPQAPVWGQGPLGPLLRDLFDALKPAAERQGVVLDLCDRANGAQVSMDEPRLRSAFTHLLRLVLQQEASGGRVAIHLAVDPHGERPMVDGYLEGASLKRKDLDLARLFEPFYFRESGLGRLALPVARRIFESHDGRLTAGAGPKGGLRLHFTLPVAASPAPVAES